MDKSEPLWMPRGSVRSIIALFVVGVFGSLALQHAIGEQDMKDVVILVIGFYFGTRQQDKPVATT